MSLLDAVTVIGSGVAAAMLWLRWAERAARDVPRKAAAARYVDAPGYPAPLARREPSRALAAVDDHDLWQEADTQDADHAPDTDTGPDLWSAIYPPGSLGQHPERMPEQPGRMTLEDSLDIVIAASKLTRAAAERSQQA